MKRLRVDVIMDSTRPTIWSITTGEEARLKSLEELQAKRPNLQPWHIHCYAWVVEVPPDLEDD